MEGREKGRSDLKKGREGREGLSERRKVSPYHLVKVDNTCSLCKIGILNVKKVLHERILKGFHIFHSISKSFCRDKIINLME